MVELYHLTGCSLFAHCAADMREMATETCIMLAVLGLIAVVMIANLLVMVIVGGWETSSRACTWKAIRTSPDGCRTSMPAC